MRKKNLLTSTESSLYKEDTFERARKRLKELKGFYWHLFWYLAVNLFISISKIVSDMEEGQTFMESLFDYGTFTVWFFWGIGLASHWLGVFGKNLIFSKNWEKRKVDEFIEKDKQRWE